MKHIIGGKNGYAAEQLSSIRAQPKDKTIALSVLVGKYYNYYTFLLSTVAKALVLLFCFSYYDHRHCC